METEKTNEWIFKGKPWKEEVVVTNKKIVISMKKIDGIPGIKYHRYMYEFKDISVCNGEFVLQRRIIYDMTIDPFKLVYKIIAHNLLTLPDKSFDDPTIGYWEHSKEYMAEQLELLMELF